MTVAYCAYCKASILNRNQKCPNCGSTVFRTDDEPAAPVYAQSEPRVVQQPVYIEKPVYVERTVYVEQPATFTSRKSWVVALVLCILFGAAGFHRFYVGKVGSGLMFLFTAGWFGIGWLVDIISILSGNFRDSYGLPVNR